MFWKVVIKEKQSSIRKQLLTVKFLIFCLSLLVGRLWYNCFYSWSHIFLSPMRFFLLWRVFSPCASVLLLCMVVKSVHYRVFAMQLKSQWVFPCQLLTYLQQVITIYLKRNDKGAGHQKSREGGKGWQFPQRNSCKANFFKNNFCKHEIHFLKTTSASQLQG